MAEANRAQSPGEGASPDDHTSAEAGRDEATVAYTPGMTPFSGANSSAPRSPAASSAEYPFLEPAREDGDELGWLAHYRVRRLLGSGGMGLVFLADDTHLMRPVALKVIRPELASVPQAAARFAREARTAAAIKDDNIVTIYQVGEASGVAFLAMEYLQGISLQRWLERGKRPSVDLILRLGRETAGGLVAAHKLGLVHRDIKPGNLWLEAPNGRLKILDFGQARAEREDIQITQSGAIMGTPAFMSPEQASGESVEASSDLFSLGCVLYRLATGRLPFQGKTILAVLNALSNQTPPNPRDLNPDIPRRLDTLIMSLLAKSPAERPSSAQEVLNELRAIEKQILQERQGTQLVVPGSKPVEAPTPVGLADILAAGSEAGDEPIEALPNRQTATSSAHSPFAAGHWKAAAAIVVLSLLGIFGLSRFFPGGSTKAPLQARSASPVVSPTNTPATAPSTITGSATAAEPSARVEAAPPVAVQPPPSGAVEKPVEKPVDVAVEAAPSPPINAVSGDPKAPGSTEVFWGRFIDPDGDCRFERSADGREASLYVPGTAHALSVELPLLNAPRLLQSVRGDFSITVRVRGTESSAGRPTLRQYSSAYHGAGFLLWQDERNYVRLELASEFARGNVKPRRYVNWEYRRDGELVASHGQSVTDEISYLRLQRTGATLVAAYGPDGEQWTTGKPLETMLDNEISLGLTAVNTATKPLEAVFDEFSVIHGDPGPVDPAAPVLVRVTPSKSEYRSDEPVEVRLEIVNNSKNPISLPGDRGGSQRYHLLVTDAAGKPRARSREEPPAATPGPVTVLPAEGRLNDTILVKPNDDKWEPGVYTIRIDAVLLGDGTQPSADPPTTIASEPVEFTIRPTESE